MWTREELCWLLKSSCIGYLGHPFKKERQRELSPFLFFAIYSPDRCMIPRHRGSPQLVMMWSGRVQHPQTQEVHVGTSIHLAL